MKFKTKSIIKKVALVLAGITAVTALGVGAKAIYDRAKDDLKTITPTFEVGNLGSDGKFVNDKSTLYTKEAFEAEGLQIKLDFDSQINYQIFYYDDLDNFVESTAVLSSAYSKTVHDGYARIVITPTDDEDGKISLVERVTYPGQMTIKVSKEQNVQYHNVFNKRLQVVDNATALRFNRFFVDFKDGEYSFSSHSQYASTTMDLLNVGNNKYVTFSNPSGFTADTCNYVVYSFSDNCKFIGEQHITSGVKTELIRNTQFVLIVFSTFTATNTSGTNVSETTLLELNSCISLSK